MQHICVFYSLYTLYDTHTKLAQFSNMLEFEQFQILNQINRQVEFMDQNRTLTCMMPQNHLNSVCLFKAMEEEVLFNISYAFTKVEIKPVIYDLSTKFSNGDNSFPFEERKSNMPPMLFDFFD